MLNFSNTIKLFFLGLLETDQQEKDSFFKFSLSMLFIIIILILINFIVYFFYPDNTEAIRIQAEKLIHERNHHCINP